MSEYQYNKVTPEMIEKFKEIAPKRVLVGDEINEDFTHDEMAIYGKARPEVLVEATSTEEVAAVVKLCNENKVPVTPSGARTGLVGGAVSIGGGVMISLTKMNKILGYDKENFVVKIQSGVLLNDLAQDAEKQGLLYPPDPGEKFATVGGNVATNAGGMRAVKYGCTRDYVRAMTVVLPTGEIVKLGATVSKTSSGYSLLNLMIGSEGTLGIITELTLKVIPAPKSVISLIIPYENLEDCIATVPQFFMHHLAPQAQTLYEGSDDGYGVDAKKDDAVTEDNLEYVIQMAKNMAKKTKAVIVITGKTDLVTDGQQIYLIDNGVLDMSRITGTGCMLDGVIAGFIGANPDQILEAVTTAVSAMGICGEYAKEKAEGTGTLKVHLMDAMSNMNAEWMERSNCNDQTNKEE